MAETLNGLDIVSATEEEFFQGAPILLYMWLLKRFRFILTNQIPPGIMHDSSLFFCCPITYAFTDLLLDGSGFFWRALGILGGVCRGGG